MLLSLPPYLIIGGAFSLSLTCVGLVRKYLQNQLIDIPNERSSHITPTPRGGGLGFIIAISLTILFAHTTNQNLLAGISPILWLVLLPLIGIGLLDDWISLSSSIRYLAQLSVASAIVYYCHPFQIPGIETFGLVGHWMAIGLTIIGITALINFYNFMDGLDGLVAGIAVAQLSFLALWYHEPVLWLWVSVLLGFLFWNWSPAKIFMGDAGSTTIGALVSIALLSAPQQSMELSWSTLAILLPIVGDAIYTICRRLFNGENIFKAHRSHLYQRLNQAGWSHTQVASTYIGFTCAIAIGVNSFGAIVAWITLGTTLITILIAELYLTRSTQLART